MLARKPWAGNPSIPSQARCVGVNYMTAFCSLGRTISPLPGKGTTLGKESKALSYYSLVSLTLFLFQEHTVLISAFRILQLLSPLLECSASKTLQISSILPFNYYLKCHLLWILVYSWTNLSAKLSYGFCISQQIYLEGHLSSTVQYFQNTKMKEIIIMVSVPSRNSNCIHMISMWTNKELEGNAMC